MYKISAIVSAYYAETFLQGRLENLMQQTVKPQIVVVCQKDSEEHSVTKKFEADLILTEDVPTVYAAWNKGLLISEGEYITNANCDDRLHPVALERLAQELDAHPQCAVAYSNVAIVEKPDGPVVGQYQWAEGGLAKLLEGCFLGPMPMWRRKLHEKYGMFDESLHSAGDYEFWLRLASRGEKFRHIKEVLGVYLNRKDSVEHRELIRSTWETARVRARYR